jgi:chromosome segregation ATPase
MSRAILEAQEKVNALQAELNDKLLAGTATTDDMMAVQEAVAALTLLEPAPVIECCERANEWNTLLDNARREAEDLRIIVQKKDAELEELKQSTTTLQIEHSRIIHEFEGAQRDVANAQARAEMLIANKTVIEDELIATQEKLDLSRKEKRQADIEIESLSSRLNSALGDVEGLAATNRAQRHEIEESNAALNAANLTITELERQLADANALATQRRIFAENVRKANEGFALDNQRLRERIERLAMV